MSRIRNARFWEWHNNDWVKITLFPGQTLATYRKWRTDEGYREEWNDWTLEDGVVHRVYGSSEKDCDGKVSDHCHQVCSVEDLHDPNQPERDTWHDGKRITFPAWSRYSIGQRDYSAEAAGY